MDKRNWQESEKWRPWYVDVLAGMGVGVILAGILMVGLLIFAKAMME